MGWSDIVFNFPSSGVGEVVRFPVTLLLHVLACRLTSVVVIPLLSFLMAPFGFRIIRSSEYLERTSQHIPNSESP